MTLVSLDILAQVSLLAFGLSYVITGSLIGYLVRLPARLILKKAKLDTLAFCPSCNAWWGALFIALLSGLCIVGALQCAFVACGVAAIAQAQWQIAADDRDDIDKTWASALRQVDEKKGREKWQRKT